MQHKRKESLPRLHEAGLRFATHYETALRETNRLSLKGGEGQSYALKILQVEWDNIKTGWTWAAKLAKDNRCAVELNLSYPESGSHIMGFQLHVRESIRWLEVAVAAAQQLQQRPTEGIRPGNLGNQYADLGETRQAMAYYEQALAIARVRKPT